MNDFETICWIIVEDDVITHIAYSPDEPPGDGWEHTSDKVEHGFTRDGKGGWMPSGGTDAVVMEITRRQLLLELAAVGLITPQEAIAAATLGAVPAKIEKVISTLTAADQLGARITWATMSVALRYDPLVLALASAENLDERAVNALFARAAAR